MSRKPGVVADLPDVGGNRRTYPADRAYVTKKEGSTDPVEPWTARRGNHGRPHTPRGNDERCIRNVSSGDHGHQAYLRQRRATFD